MGLTSYSCLLNSIKMELWLDTKRIDVMCLRQCLTKIVKPSGKTSYTSLKPLTHFMDRSGSGYWELFQQVPGPFDVPSSLCFVAVV